MITYRKSGKVISIVELKLNFIDGKTIFYDKMGNDSLVQHYKRGELIADGH
jgi:antitoxin component YwqK of YwqJK toxin-antitoxin module